MDKIIEGNRLIAEFHGWKHYPTPKQKGKGYWSFPEWGKAYFGDGDFKYHSSWDWLMPVVDKIRECGFKFIIGDKNRVTVYNKDYDWINGTTSDSMIECVWYGCVQFIKWYNTQTN